MTGKNPTYRDQFDKLTIAYIKNEVDPNVGCACFVGNLLNGDMRWSWDRDINYNYNHNKINPTLSRYTDNINYCLKRESNSFYSPFDILELEKCFLNTYYLYGGKDVDSVSENSIKEDALFIAFEKTLSLLKEIHISKGEIIDEEPIFKKRNLIPVNN